MKQKLLLTFLSFTLLVGNSFAQKTVLYNFADAMYDELFAVEGNTIIADKQEVVFGNLLIRGAMTRSSATEVYDDVYNRAFYASGDSDAKNGLPQRRFLKISVDGACEINVYGFFRSADKTLSCLFSNENGETDLGTIDGDGNKVAQKCSFVYNGQEAGDIYLYQNDKDFSYCAVEVILDGQEVLSISSPKINGVDAVINGNLISATIPYGYVHSTVPVEFNVNATATVLINEVEVDNNNGIVITAVETPEKTDSYEITLIAEDETISSTYYLTISRDEQRESGIIVSGTSKTWDFTNWSETTLSDLDVDTENWEYSSSNNRYSNLVTMNGELIANGNVIAETKGLLFDENTDGRTRIDVTSNNRLSLNSSNVTITIDNVKANQIFSITVQSSSNSAERSITLSNSNPIDGDNFIERSIRKFEILEDGSVTLKFGNGGVYIYSIEIEGSGSIPLTAEALEGLSEVSLTGDITSEDIDILNAANLTSINLESASSLAAGLAPSNPNCLVFATSALSIATTDAVSSFNLIIDGKAENITLTDGNAFNNPTAFTADNISYIRDYETAGWASLYLPFEVTSVPSGVVVKEFTDIEGITAIFDEVTELEGNTPYIANVTSTGEVEYTATDVTVLASADMAEIIQGDYAFKGTFSRIDDATGLFLLHPNGEGFGVGVSGSFVAPFRSYIEYIGVETTDVKLLALGNGDGSTTGVDIVEVSDLTVYPGNNTIEIIAAQAQEVIIYGVDGRLVTKVQVTEGHNTISGLAKGIYLLNNQKVAVK